MDRFLVAVCVVSVSVAPPRDAEIAFWRRARKDTLLEKCLPLVLLRVATPLIEVGNHRELVTVTVEHQTTSVGPPLVVQDAARGASLRLHVAMIVLESVRA